MNLKRIALMGAASLAIASMGGSAGLAQGYAGTFGRIPNVLPLGQVAATASSTFATTSYAALPGATITFTPPRSPTETEAPTGQSAPTVFLWVDWSLDVTKATATTLSCQLVANGAGIAASTRTIDTAAKEGTMAEHYEVALTAGGSQTVSLQCKSGDTNTGTVNTGVLSARVAY